MSRLGVAVSGRIAVDERVDEGRVVARLTDLGWGQRLRALLAPDAPDWPADPALLAACVDVLAGWGWAARPAAVLAMPSVRRPRLVGSVADHLATLGRLPHLGSLALTTGEPAGEPGGNSAFRLAAVHDRFTVPSALAASLAGLDGPVLLVDDLVDSRWTLTVAGRLVRRAGAPGVLPFALAAAA
jgi:ATP-dependent DNA helicase RecQ